VSSKEAIIAAKKEYANLTEKQTHLQSLIESVTEKLNKK
jgi:hypothetical protein